jgi:hypothetical protein
MIRLLQAPTQNQYSCNMPIDDFSLRASFPMGFFLLDSLSSSACISGVIKAFCHLIHIPEHHISSVDPIPTNLILSYFSAFQSSFDGTRVVKERYEKVIPLS